MNRTKAEWRRILLAARASIPETERRQGSLAMSDHVRGLAGFESARSLLTYLPIGAEADPTPLLDAGRDSGRGVFVPVGDAEGVSRWAVWGESASIVAAASLRYPVVAVVPGVGYDERGVRLGRGRGFYDRALAELRRAGSVCCVGLGFECQIVETLPRDPWDESVDFVVSERRIVAGELTNPARAGRGSCP